MNTYISKELAQWLKERGCKIETDMYWNTFIERDFTEKVRENAPFLGLKVERRHRWELGSWYHENVPAYSWYDILVTYAKEFWGEENTCPDCAQVFTEANLFRNLDFYKGWSCKCGFNVDPSMAPAYSVQAEQILAMLQDGEIAEAETYVREYSLFASQTQND